LLLINGFGPDYYLAGREWPQMLAAVASKPASQSDEYPFFYVDVSTEAKEIVAQIGLSKFIDVLAKEGKFRADARLVSRFSIC
jgi:hypothetical protein